MSQQPLTVEQAKMVSMTCQGQTNTSIAEALGVARKTIIRWHKLPHIRDAIAQASNRQTEAVAQQQGEQYKQITKFTQLETTEIVEKLLPVAVKTVAQILTNQEARDSDRLKAAELLTKWGGLGQSANQAQQTSEQVLNLCLANLSSQPHANNN